MSKPVAEVLQQAEQALEGYVQADRVTRSVESLTGLEEDMALVMGSLRQVAAAFEVLAQAGLTPDPPDTQALSATCREAAQWVRQHQDRPQDIHRTLAQIKKTVRDGSDSAEENWRAFIGSCLPGLEGMSALADMLSNLGADRQQANSLRSSAVELRKLSRVLPDERAPGRALALAADVRAALAALLGGSDSGNQEVQRFMTAISRGGASLQALTPAVTDWMRRHNIEGEFKIAAGRPVSE